MEASAEEEAILFGLFDEKFVYFRSFPLECRRWKLFEAAESFNWLSIEEEVSFVFVSAASTTVKK